MKKESLDLKNYILHLDNWIPQNILDDSLKELKKNKTWERHAYTTSENYEACKQIFRDLMFFFLMRDEEYDRRICSHY